MSLPDAPPVTIRRALRDDVPAIGRLAALLVRMHHELDPERFIPAWSRTADGYGSFLGSQLRARDAVVLVADADGAVVGYAWGTLEGHDYMSLRGPAGVLQDIIVDPAHRTHGVGRLLLDATVAALEAIGAPRIVLSTAARNEPAQRLFARAGFRPTMIEMTREVGTDPQPGRRIDARSGD